MGELIYITTCRIIIRDFLNEEESGLETGLVGLNCMTESIATSSENVMSLSATYPSPQVISTTLSTFFSCDIELWPMTLTFKTNPYIAKVNHHAEYEDSRSFHSYVIDHTHRHTPDRLVYPDH